MEGGNEPRACAVCYHELTDGRVLDDEPGSGYPFSIKVGDSYMLDHEIGLYSHHVNRKVALSYKCPAAVSRVEHRAARLTSRFRPLPSTQMLYPSFVYLVSSTLMRQCGINVIEALASGRDPLLPTSKYSALP